MIMSLNVDGALHDVSASSKIDLTKLYIKTGCNVNNGSRFNNLLNGPTWTDYFSYPCYHLIYWIGYDVSSGGSNNLDHYLSDCRFTTPQYYALPQDGTSITKDFNDSVHSGVTRLTITNRSLTITRVVTGYDIQGVNYIAIGLKL